MIAMSVSYVSRGDGRLYVGLAFDRSYLFYQRWRLCSSTSKWPAGVALRSPDEDGREDRNRELAELMELFPHPSLCAQYLLFDLSRRHLASCVAKMADE